MEYSCAESEGQHGVIISASLATKIAQHCATSHMLRGWHDHFETSISQVDRRAAIKGYDLIVDGVISAREIARELGFPLPDVRAMRWELTPREDRADSCQL